MTTTVDTIIKIMREVKGLDRFAEPFVGPIGAVVIEELNGFEPVAESIAQLANNLLTAGADHTGTVASLGAILTQIGQAFMTHGVLAPPPASAAADAVADNLPPSIAGPNVGDGVPAGGEA
jgi:hypothetical protein